MGRGKRGHSRRGNAQIREVWSRNFDLELANLNDCLNLYPILTIDTEFPGFIRSTPWGAIEEKLYDDFRFNVNRTKLIQLGLTASDEIGNIGSTWEFNFSDFDPQIDTHNASSVSFLKQNGLDFDKLKEFGIPINEFTSKAFFLFRKHRIVRWVTFHGLYDIGYLLKAMGVAGEIPESMEEFAELVERALGNVSDLKHMAQFCEGLEDGKLGLEKLAQLMNQKRFGNKHHAGSDSLLTASLYAKMKNQFELGSEVCDGFLYGLRIKLHAKIKLYQNLMFGQIPYGLRACYPPCYIAYY
ncbi:putative CCR4-associated factor 1 homolog 8 [Momordica charantia]|uniref:poly(A)-specific ribonuclease n=1 Tax=Momordica charantia TaxID=3673 RepID=A0A6J1CXP9_MOMCH|nr:putative CCR4-associated factor 1 homolog 8 [Momordica charantia]